MRRFAVLGVLLAVMLGLDALKADEAGKHSLTLAAIGFVLLAAFTVAQVGTLLRLPRVTGYILSGLILGPSVSDILSHDVVTEMRMFNTLALGLIAVGAGLELSLKEIGRVWKTLAGTLVIKVVLGVALVTGTAYVVESWLGSLELPSVTHVAVLALVLGALSIGTSPSIALAV
jgi:Kef-type K+ transport system membrane component KefB